MRSYEVNGLLAVYQQREFPFIENMARSSEQKWEKLPSVSIVYNFTSQSNVKLKWINSLWLFNITLENHSLFLGHPALVHLSHFLGVKKCKIGKSSISVEHDPFVRGLHVPRRSQERLQPQMIPEGKTRGCWDFGFSGSL